ncbi:DUF6907 domain-containing protein [Streptomyces sp. NPDC008141]|uniref:DUF6907 domain-containing protein n=1 Tax=Streptomyces sp. NPDC008141 TaxID=3364815 RepID=UPI0036F0F88C
MKTIRTITVQTHDHGPVIVREPSWCLGDHPDGGNRSDITHTGRMVQLTLGGQTMLASAQLAQWPYSVRSRVPFVAVEFADGEHEYDPAELQALSAALTEFASITLPLVGDLLQLAIETEEAGHAARHA